MKIIQLRLMAIYLLFPSPCLMSNRSYRSRDELKRKLQEELRSLRGETSKDPCQQKSLVEMTSELKKSGQHILTEHEMLIHTLETDIKSAKPLEKKNELFSTSWKLPHSLQKLSQAECDKLRENLLLDVSGNPPPPISTFRHMKLPDQCIQSLKALRITVPTPVQMQGIPAALAGRNVIGVAYTGSGKCFAPGTLLLVWGGGEMPVERLQVGDRLIGDDGTPRTITSLSRGSDVRYRITPAVGSGRTSFDVNGAHILVLWRVDTNNTEEMTTEKYFQLSTTDRRQYRMITARVPPFAGSPLAHSPAGYRPDADCTPPPSIPSASYESRRAWSRHLVSRYGRPSASGGLSLSLPTHLPGWGQQEVRRVILLYLYSGYQVSEVHKGDITISPHPREFPRVINVTFPFSVSHTHSHAPYCGFTVEGANRRFLLADGTITHNTMVFTLPTVLLSLERQMRHPLGPGEGPFALILAPSRELAQQTYQVTLELTRKAPPCPDSQKTGRGSGSRADLRDIRAVRLIGGLPLAPQLAELRQGVHIVIGTPGRVRDLVTRGQLRLSQCRILALDEGDQILSEPFVDDVRSIMSTLPSRRQMLVFSATLPDSVRSFASSAMADPVCLDAGRSAAASLDVLQEFQVLERGHEFTTLAKALCKTPPPTVVFAQDGGAVIRLVEYLALKGVAVCGLCGEMDQEERLLALSQFSNGDRDVLVATDVASKGLDFPGTRHVINTTLPPLVETYIHRIGRTGRRGVTGIATTFLTTSTNPSMLADLRALLVDCGQPVPPILGSGARSGSSCPFCPGLGHSLEHCPKLQRRR
eukprot:gnl/Dysnectes_brevis/3945_a5142_472.p1 GENE.gnl/Dysnectes_brevis/3945_a5142_472~~gnl/Dysnectes_brevis/3945_a5142_472.p1  ORF type:complete len:814 (-),score=60.42 gnl/Dysnectes_brevis/3945_a5142_472:61-2502(-)